MKTKIFNWLLVFLWMGVIFFFSHQPDLKSSLPESWDFIFRKIAHITEYAILTWLLFRALALRAALSQNRKFLLAALAIAIFYAISDEYHQTFVFGRQGCLRDVLIDSLGIFLVVWLIERKMVEYKRRISNF